MFRCQNLLGSQASTHSTFNLIGPCNTHPNRQSHKRHKVTKPQRYTCSHYWHIKIAQQWKIIKVSPEKVVAVTYKRWLFTRVSNWTALTGKILMFWIGGRLREVASLGGLTVSVKLVYTVEWMVSHASSPGSGGMHGSSVQNAIPVLISQPNSWCIQAFLWCNHLISFSVYLWSFPPRSGFSKESCLFVCPKNLMFCSITVLNNHPSGTSSSFLMGAFVLLWVHDTRKIFIPSNPINTNA